MTYTPPNTFTTATPLTATALNGNLDAIATYYTHTITTANMATASLVTADIVRPRVTPINESLTSVYLQTGSLHNLTLPCIDWVGDATALLLNVPFVPSGFVCIPYQPKSFGTLQFKPIPRTWISFYVWKTSSVLMRANGSVIFPEDHTGTLETSAIYCQLDGDGSKGLESMCRIPEMDSATDVYGGRLFQTCCLFDSLAVGWHHIGLVCGVGSNLGLIAGTQIVVEVIHTGA